jgi:hypothetical protein
MVENDSFNAKSRDKVNFKVECSRKLYDAFKTKKGIKEEWQPRYLKQNHFERIEKCV